MGRLSLLPGTHGTRGVPVQVSAPRDGGGALGPARLSFVQLEASGRCAESSSEGEAHQTWKARNLKEQEGVEVLQDVLQRSSTLDETDRQPGLFTNDLQDLLSVLKR